jgi:DNA-binding transcriptional regulator YiaG
MSEVNPMQKRIYVRPAVLSEAERQTKAALIRKQRVDYSLPQSVIAKVAGCTQQNVSLAENGRIKGKTQYVCILSAIAKLIAQQATA